jgi:transposase InsO family protein
MFCLEQGHGLTAANPCGTRLSGQMTSFLILCYFGDRGAAFRNGDHGPASTLGIYLVKGYKRQRRHSTLGYATPAEFEKLAKVA